MSGFSGEGPSYNKINEPNETFRYSAESLLEEAEKEGYSDEILLKNTNLLLSSKFISKDEATKVFETIEKRKESEE